MNEGGEVLGLGGERGGGIKGREIRGGRRGDLGDREVGEGVGERGEAVRYEEVEK